MPPQVSVWTDPPKMTTGTPDPCLHQQGEDVLVAYRTWRTDDHFAVVRFGQVHDFTFGDPSDDTLGDHPLYAAGLTFYAFHEIHDASLGKMGLRRWIVTFHDETLDITAREAEILVRAIRAPSAEHALASLEA